MTLEAKIEAVLFWKGEPVTIKELAKFLNVEKEVVIEALSKLETALSGRGISLVRNGEGNGAEVMLYTNPEASDLIKALTKDELSRDISKAAVEVLSLVIYRGPIAKRDIDYIRGVNSSYIIRNLLVRGLIEKVDSKDARSFVYQPTFELLAHLGISKREDLPDFAAVEKDVAAFMASSESSEPSEATTSSATNTETGLNPGQ